MSHPLPAWLEALVAGLLVLSGVFALLSAWGFVGLRDFFARMHPPALAYTGGTWCAVLAGVVYFSALEAQAEPRQLLIIILLFMTVPVTSVLLARVTLFRRRAARLPDTPPPLTPPPG